MEDVDESKMQWESTTEVPKELTRADITKLVAHLNPEIQINWEKEDKPKIKLSPTDVKDLHEQFLRGQRGGEDLVRREILKSWDASARKSATDIEKHAARIVYRVREFERAAHDGPFGNVASEDIPPAITRDMGGQFLTNKDRIDKRSKLFDISKAMPKGGLLHLHLNAQILPGQVLDFADENVPDSMFIASNRHLIQEDDFALCEIQVAVLDFPKSESEVEANLFDRKNFTCFRGTKPNTNDRMQWMRWSFFREEFIKTTFAKDRNAESKSDYTHQTWVKEKLILSPEEVYGSHQTVNGIWARFNQSTRAFKGFLNYESAFKWYIGAAIDEMVEDGIMYAEMRPMWLDKSIPRDNFVNGAQSRALDHQGQIDIIKDVLKEKKKDFEFGLKIIYCTPRSIPRELMRREIADCINLHRKNPEIMCGFDLVGAEDRQFHAGHYLEELFAMKKLCEVYNVEIPFMFHAGETLLDRGGSFNTANSNLYGAVNLGAKRIGHGFALPKHPDLMKDFAGKDEFGKVHEDRNKICIELCPISNELLHLCRNVKEHPFPQLLEAGIPCSLNSDNPSLFSSSLSHEFYQVMVGWPRMTLHGWKQLAIWSIEYSCLSPRKQQDALRNFRGDWQIFCYWIVKTYHNNVFEAKPAGEKPSVSFKKFKDDFNVESRDTPDEFDAGRVESVRQDYRKLAEDITSQMPYELQPGSYKIYD